MSYILEALADSEQSRQQITSTPRYSLLPVVGEERPGKRLWPYALGAALMVNAAVLYLWLRPAPAGAIASAVMPAPAPAHTRPTAAEPGNARLALNDKPAAEAAARDMQPPQSPPQRADGLRGVRPPEAAAAVSRTGLEYSTNDNTPIQSSLRLSPKVPANPLPSAVARTAATPSPAPAMIAAAAPAAIAKPVLPVPAPTPATTATTAPAAMPKPIPQSPAPTPATTATAAPAAMPKPIPQSPAPADGTAELPLALQRELPPISVAGFIRDEGTGGMVIVNDRLVREGDEIAPGVKLESIVNDSLIFNYKGYRFKR